MMHKNTYKWLGILSIALIAILTGLLVFAPESTPQPSPALTEPPTEIPTQQPTEPPTEPPTEAPPKKLIVIDAGHQ